MLADYAAHLEADMVLVALDERADLRGFAVILHQQGGFWLENIAVDPSTQGQGFGSQNREPEDFDSVTAEFDRLGKTGLARRMGDLAARRDKTP